MPVFSFTGLVIGSVIYSFPFALQPLRQTFAAIGKEPLEVAATLGANRLDCFRYIILPQSISGFISAAVLCFAHTIGEFGVALMLGGNIPGSTKLISMMIYEHAETLNYARANTVAVMLEKTIKSSAAISGIGIHAGKYVNMVLHPAPDNHGIVFNKKTAAGNILIPASYQYAVESELCTTIVRDGEHIRTIEHLMAALSAMEIDNVLIDIDGDEVPILDGSAKPYIDLLKKTGVRTLKTPRRYIEILSPVELKHGESILSLKPAERTIYTCSIDFKKYPVIGEQKLTFIMDCEQFINDISYARTFGFYDENKRQQLYSRGLANGASFENTVFVHAEKGNIINDTGLRDSQEFVKHKLLDAVGDMNLAGNKIIGHFSGIRPGHSLILKLLKQLFDHPESYRMITRAARAA
ncbi:hypothetical protein CHS0354_002056 [Potamilus streckersoni]|uniref:UDP-3-O-acyl-N-acetylglucosamine deacetylase n=1 Tax=Potamilus streckersoni TaxID=2493646 RepID=A0AAE0T687_9BIVA|nr:hypothetical protein CHS0354_002056 [Potamilus streckersoni]